MNHSISRFLGIVSLLGPLSLSSTSNAQDVATADALFNRGVSEMKEGHYKTGCPLIAESLRVDPQPGTLFTLSQCEVKWDRVATAVARLDDYLQLYERLTPDQKLQQLNRPKVVREQRGKLILDVPQLTLLLPPGAPAGTVVRRDDALVASAALGLGLPVDPGEHLVSTQVPGGAVWEQQITIAKGEKKSLVLEVRTVPPVEARPVLVAPVSAAAPVPAERASSRPENKTAPSGRRVATYITGGIGFAGIVFGAVTGGLMLSKKSLVTARCNDAGVCADRDSVDAANAAKALANMSTVGWAVALAGVGTATLLFLTEPPRPKAAAASIGSPPKRVKTTRLSMNVGPVGPRGGLIEIGGTW